MRNRSLLIGLFATAMLASACGGQHKKDPNAITSDDLDIPASGYDEGDASELPQMTFDSTTMMMGRIAQGVQVEKVFVFTNTGKRDLVITAVTSPCGCTTVKDWPKGPVHPGKQGAIALHFNSDGMSGEVDKSVNISANTVPFVSHIHLKGEVIAPPTN